MYNKITLIGRLGRDFVIILYQIQPVNIKIPGILKSGRGF